VANASFLDCVLEQMVEAKGLKTRAMFGGHGLYIGSAFFGIVHRGALYLRTDEASRLAYMKAGSRPFNPRGQKELHRYYEVPADILEDSEELLIWAKRATKTRG
jgi:DNA transformation protein